MEPRGKRFFDSVCPDLPVLHVADQDICAELAANLSSQTVGTSAFSAEKIASMIVGSQHLRRIALNHSDDINRILNGFGAEIMERAKHEFLAEMACTSDEAVAMHSIRRLRGRSCLAVPSAPWRPGARGHQDRAGGAPAVRTRTSAAARRRPRRGATARDPRDRRLLAQPCTVPGRGRRARTAQRARLRFPSA